MAYSSDHVPSEMNAKPSSKESDDDIIAEAKERFDYTLEYESYARQRWIQDFKFVHADNTNGYQWPDKVRIERDKEAKPWLTINKTRQHCLIIENEAKKNKPGLKARPMGGQASYASGKIYDAIFRGIEYQSRAQDIYPIATDHMVKGGWGYFRVITEYLANDSDEQKITLKPVNDPLSVLLDPNIKELDGSDADFCIIFQDMPWSEFKRTYPQYGEMDKAPSAPFSATPIQSWFQKETIRVAEYMRRIHIPDTLLTYSMEGKKVSFLKSEMPAELISRLREETVVASRPTTRLKLQWFLIMGDRIIEKVESKGRYIPVMRVVAEEYVIDNRLDRPGHVRALRDPQRMYNYWATAATEYAALQTKSPWLAAKEAIEGQVDLWATSNLQNPAVLPWNAWNDEGEPNPKPEKVMPPQAAPAYLQGMQQAMQDMTMVSGQYAAMMGEPSNERSGKAINARQSQGDTATYHYVDALARAIRYAGVVIMDLIPHVYDTKRALFALQPDGAELNITIDPDAQEHFKEDKDAAEAVINPTLGIYEVQADVGPDWGTKREETFNALTLILTQAPQFAAMVGDLLFKSADFDLADEAAERLRRAVPPAILGIGPTPQEQQLTAALAEAKKQMGTLQEFSVKTVEENSKLRAILRGKEADKGVDVYNAETKRVQALAKGMSPEDIQELVTQTVHEALGLHLPQLIKGISNDEPKVQDTSILPQTGNGNS
jgi:hypothetical protein